MGFSSGPPAGLYLAGPYGLRGDIHRRGLFRKGSVIAELAVVVIPPTL